MVDSKFIPFEPGEEDISVLKLTDETKKKSRSSSESGNELSLYPLEELVLERMAVVD